MITDSETRRQLLAVKFRELYGHNATHVLRAPARINILGEHVDYVSYLPTASLPFGSQQRGMIMLLRETDEMRVRGVSLTEGFEPFSFSIEDAPACEPQKPLDEQWASWLYRRPVPAPDWSNYVKGSVVFAGLKFRARIQRGFDFLVDSTIPPKGGASSSSALTALAGAAIRQVNDIEFDLYELALDSSKAEWFVGTRGGAMDHTAICLARSGYAVHLSYARQKAELIPLPETGYRWVTFFTHEADKGREVMLAYNERVAVSRILIPALIKTTRRNQPDASLENVIDDLPAAMTLDEIAQADAAAFSECQRAFSALVTAKRNQPLKLRSRAQHHLGEVRRVAEAVQLLRENASNAEAESVMRPLGKLIQATHASLRDLYEISTPQVNQLMEIIATDEQVYGARLMGGGFGGNVLALTTTENVLPLIERVQREYYSPQQRDGMGEGAVMISTPGDGLKADFRPQPSDLRP